ncbi:putative acetyltransferase [Streptomyces sp. Amel2xB2]|uniref:GNAT family N-acetyltransferase n=1 Tax=Streptomyces sp. Amel2xB2 TaxID=1305829 RepID=UPI000DB93C8F|nr:GNAT family N-acetyltransferase [Streptomyces sp. Amel2xB2]RAJ66880.1 putative acetyltransferase [Streptomyces sp. Amel2xB2]
MALEIRRLASSDELPAWFRAVSAGFMHGADVSEEETAARTPDIELARTQGAFDGSRCVATFRTFAQEMTVPGGAVLPSCAITNVSVTATHRRRGLLTRMMGDALTAAKKRGDAFASLVSAEYPIYGRYGFGPASWSAEWEVDVARSGVDGRYAGPGDGARVDLADDGELARVGPALHDRFRTGPHRAGAIDRPERWWRIHTGRRRFPDDGFTPAFHAVYRDARGEPQGFVSWTVRERWEAKVPEYTAQVQCLTALTPAAERALWLFVLSVDWVARVRSGQRPPDDVLPLLLPDPRAARLVSLADFLWLRPLDVPRMLRARGYPVEGSLVLDVRDAAKLADGRCRLTAGPGGATCEATRESPDLTLDARELGTLFLGDESAVRLAALGRVEAHREGAAEWADTLFRTPRRAWCPDVF